MINKEHIKHFITEDIFLVEEKEPEKVKFLVACQSLNEEEKTLLEKILKAIGISEEEYELEVGSTKKITNYQKALIFAEKPFGEFYKVKDYKGSEILSSKSLSQIKDSNQEKSKLWNALKSWLDIT